jgi:hypothetical protein
MRRPSRLVTAVTCTVTITAAGLANNGTAGTAGSSSGIMQGTTWLLQAHAGAGGGAGIVTANGNYGAGGTGDAGSNGFERDGGAGANGSNLSRGASGTTDPGSIDPSAGSGGQDGYAVVIY